MVLTPSTMLALGTPAPHFQLPDVISGQTITLDSLAANKALLVIFICPHCLFVIKYELAKLGKDYGDRSVGIVAIGANDIETHPNDSPAHLKAMAEELGFNFPFCYDESQSVAQAYTAACTPDFFLFDDQRQLVYRGQLDSSRPGNTVPVDGQDLRAAIDALLTNQPINPEQRPSIGCNIKWKPANTPSYYSAASRRRGILNFIQDQLRPRLSFLKRT